MTPRAAPNEIAAANTDGEEMTGSKHNREGNSGEQREPDPGPYWRRMHLDWRFWVGALFMAAALAIYSTQRRPCMGTAQPTASARTSGRREIRSYSSGHDVGET
jgi:hypothetical protein